ncbi:MAG: hypothetical protein ACREBJ_12145, partial [Nitrosotalea sp.]
MNLDTSPIISELQNGSMSILDANARNQLQNLDCKSCAIFQESPLPALPVPFISTTTFLYQIKLWQEDKKLAKTISPEAKTDLLFQFSLKRTSEFFSLINLSSRRPVTTEWKPVLERLNSYMNEIDNQTSQYINQANFTELIKIKNYLTFILNTIKDLNNDPFVQRNSDLQIALNNIFWVTDDISNKINTFFNSYVNQKYVTYNMEHISKNQSIAIPLDSLPTSADNSPIFPSSYVIDSGTIFPSISVRDQQLIVGDIPFTTYLTLHFDYIFNIAAKAAKDVSLLFPSGSKECLMVTIPNYSWRDAYYVGVNKSLPFHDGFGYITASYPSRIDSVENNTSGYFQFDKQFSYSPSKSNMENSVIFYGDQGYTDATAYFCPMDTSD